MWGHLPHCDTSSAIEVSQHCQVLLYKVYTFIIQWNLTIKVTHMTGQNDLNGEVTLLQGVICTVEYNLGLSQSDCNGEVFLLVR